MTRGIPGRVDEVRGKVEQLEGRLVELRGQLEVLRGQAQQARGTLRVRLARLERQAAAQLQGTEIASRTRADLSDVVLALAASSAGALAFTSNRRSRSRRSLAARSPRSGSGWNR